MTVLTETVALGLADGSSVACAGWWEPSRNAQFGVGTAQYASQIDVYVDTDLVAGEVVTATVDGVVHQVVSSPGAFPRGSIISRHLVISCAALLTDPCTVSRHEGDTRDPVNGAMVPNWVDVWSGNCRIVSTNPNTYTTAGEPVALTDPEVLLPLSAPSPAIGYRVQTNDATLFVSGVITGTNLALRRITATTKTGADR